MNQIKQIEIDMDNVAFSYMKHQNKKKEKKLQNPRHLQNKKKEKDLKGRLETVGKCK